MRYKDKSGHLPVRDFLKFLFCHTLLHVLVYNQQICVQKLAKSCDGHYFFYFFYLLSSGIFGVEIRSD